MKRFAISFTFAALLVGIVAMPSGAASFVDWTPCPAGGPLLVCPTGQVGQPYSVQLLARDGCDTYRWETPNGTVPTGLTMSSSGLVSGTPTTAGEWMPWVHVHDLTAAEGGPSWCAASSSSQRQFVFKVVAGLSIRDEAVPNAMLGQAYSKQLTVDSITSINPRTGSPTTANWGVASGSLPAGIALAANGVLSGTPTTEGAYTFVVRATGGGGATDSETYTINVRRPLAVTSVFTQRPAPRAEVGIPFSAQSAAAGGDGTYTWTIAEGTLPAGLTLAADGTIAGTPTRPGRYGFALAVADREGRTTRVNVTLVVAARLAITTRTLKAAEVGVAYRAKIAKLGGVAPILWTIRGKLPKGLTFVAKQGLLLGKPTQAGTFRLSVQAVDALGARSTKTLKLVVSD